MMPAPNSKEKHVSDVVLESSTHLAVQSEARPRYRLRWRGIVASEWIKLVTTRSTVVTLLASAVVLGLIGCVAALTATGDTQAGAAEPPGFGGDDPLTTILAGQNLAVLILAVVGVMLGAREYSSHLSRTTYAAVPHRWRVLLARTLVFSVAASVVVAIGLTVAFVAGNSILDAGDAATVAWSDDGVPRAVFGTLGYLVGAGVFGLGLGTITRSIGSGVGMVIALLMVIPGIGQLVVPDEWADALMYLPSNAGTSFITIDAGSDYLGAGAGGLVYLAWVLAVLVSSGVLLTKRDV
jgi:ABC-2 type transport system permease protein